MLSGKIVCSIIPSWTLFIGKFDITFSCIDDIIIKR